MMRVVRERQDELARQFGRKLARGENQILSMRATTDAKFNDVFHFMCPDARMAARQYFRLRAGFVRE